MLGNSLARLLIVLPYVCLRASAAQSGTPELAPQDYNVILIQTKVDLWHTRGISQEDGNSSTAELKLGSGGHQQHRARAGASLALTANKAQVHRSQVTATSGVLLVSMLVVPPLLLCGFLCVLALPVVKDPTPPKKEPEKLSSDPGPFAERLRASQQPDIWPSEAPEAPQELESEDEGSEPQTVAAVPFAPSPALEHIGKLDRTVSRLEAPTQFDPIAEPPERNTLEVAVGASANKDACFDATGIPIPISPHMVPEMEVVVHLQTSWFFNPDKSRLTALTGGSGSALLYLAANARDNDDIDLKLFLEADVDGACIQLGPIPVDSMSVPIFLGLEEEVYGSLEKQGDFYHVKRHSMPGAPTVLTLVRNQLPTVFELVAGTRFRLGHASVEYNKRSQEYWMRFQLAKQSDVLLAVTASIGAILMSTDLLDGIRELTHDET
mmetsp:Transcript_15195/g.34654  ORF Transcript_15195/g.34654 Transcript_15195/m.34654 type:complete len:438 (+) Transcript_15195:64-1377(+)